MADEFVVEVACAKLSGDVLNLTLQSDSLVRDLKRAIADQGTPSEPQFHPICQKLMWQSRELEDTEVLQKLCEVPQAGSKAQLEVTLLLTSQNILATFGLASPDLIVHAIKAAQTLATGDEQVLAALYRCTRWGLFSNTRQQWKRLSPARVQAAKALSGFAQTGQEEAADALIRCLTSPSREVREIAIDGLLAAQTDKTLLRQKLKKQLEELISRKDGQDATWQVLPTLEIFGLLCAPGDEEALAVLDQVLNLKYSDRIHRRILATRIALSALGHVGWDCCSTSHKLIRHFVKFCGVLMAPISMGRFWLVGDPHLDWKKTVPAVAKHMCSHGETRLSFSERTLDELTSFLSHAGQKDPACRLQGRWLAPSPNPAFVRRAAIELLAACANDAKTIVDKAWPLLQHPWEEVRIAAVTVLGETASGESGDQAVIAELTKCIQSGSVAMTQAAVTALGKVGKGNEEVISTLRSCLSHADVWVQSSVPGALMCAAGSSALEDLMKLSVHGDPEVAEAAMEALPPGDVGAIAARALDHQDPYIQAVAGKLLLKVHHMPMWTSADACLKLLEDEPKHAPEVPSAEILAAVVAAAQRRELSERKQICIGFLYALGVWQQHQEAIDVLQQLIKEKLWQPLDHAQEALRLMLERPKPKLKKIYKVKWTSSLLEISEGELPYPCRDDEHAKFWNAYRVEGFQAHLGQRDTLETGEGS